MSTNSAPAARDGRSAPAQVVAPLPFIYAAHEHVEPAFDVSATLGAAGVQVGIFDVPAYGFLRGINLVIEASGGTLGPGVFSPDAPFNVIEEVTLLDVNGAPIVGPLTGFQLYLANLFGGYAFKSDPTLLPNYATGIAFAFQLRIPVEISHHDGMGSLANQNAAASYKVRVRMAPSTTVFSTPPTTPPAVRFRGFLEAWSQPQATDLAGRVQETVPPRHGTTQFWSVQTYASVAGARNYLVSRVGNLIRNHILVVRDGTGARVANGSLPDPIELRWDARQLLLEPRTMRQARTSETLAGTPTIPNGVLLYGWDRTALGHNGDGSPALWLPTVQATRLEYVATNWPAGSLEILTNDVAPVEIDPASRYVETSSTGYTPAGG